MLRTPPRESSPTDGPTGVHCCHASYQLGGFEPRSKRDFCKRRIERWLSSLRCSFRQPAAWHDAAHRPVDHGIPRLGQPLVVLTQTTNLIQPGEGPFHDPAASQHPEATRLLRASLARCATAAGHGGEKPPRASQAPARPTRETLRCTRRRPKPVPFGTAPALDSPSAGAAHRPGPGGQCRGRTRRARTRRCSPGCAASFRPVALPRRSRAQDGRPGDLDDLAVDHAHAKVPVAPLRPAHHSSQPVVRSPEPTVEAPPAQVVVDSLLGRILTGPHPPSAVAPEQVEGASATRRAGHLGGRACFSEEASKDLSKVYSSSVRSDGQRDCGGHGGLRKSVAMTACILLP
jgi:hypothetical protein